MTTWVHAADAALELDMTIAEMDAAIAAGEVSAERRGWAVYVELEDEVEPATEATVADLTVAELKAELDARGIAYPSSARKADLVALVEESDED